MKQVKTTFVVTALLSSLWVSTNASALDLGSIGSMITGGSASTSAAPSASTVEGFLKNAKEAEGLMKNTVNILGKVFVSSEKMAEIENAQKAAEGISDPKEKDAKLKQIEADKQALVLKTIRSDEAKKKVAELDAEKKAAVSASIFNSFLLIYKDNELLAQGNSIVNNAASNPSTALSLANKLGQVKEAASSVKNQLQYLQPLSTTLVKLAKVGNIQVTQPTSSAAAPKVTSM